MFALYCDDIDPVFHHAANKQQTFFQKKAPKHELLVEAIYDSKLAE